MRSPRNEPLDAGKAGPGEPLSPRFADGEQRGVPQGERKRRQQSSEDPERRCILTRTNGARNELIRLALAPDGRVLPDVQARAPGRGAWVGVDRAALETALANGSLKRALARAFAIGALDIPAQLPHLIETSMVRMLLDRLGLELRAGNLLMGSQRIEKAARDGRVIMLFHAADASADGAAKLDQAWRVGSDSEGSGEKGVSLPLDRDSLSVALGRDNVVHLAAIDEEAVRRIVAITTRLTRYSGTGSPGRDRHAGNGGQDQTEQNDAAGAKPSAEQEFAKD